ncbi:glycine betaine uptake BCCT transporter [Saccharibacillus kuerlensis]|uniref:Glycine betaine transporter OpuD n=1 Tax=Saccharibacillus kuerlensis TaxID=459527 RepID=A0ABQ2KU51_9BACL|nr:BCCT family transporter [Saccharibacillus kuerlensis]GGN92624.1 glycine betaine transporter OpuD [Saccharibacillus kuerlensis]
MVFVVALTIIIAFVLWGAFFPEQLGNSAQIALDFSTEKFGWFYLLTAFGFLVFALYLAFGRFGRIKLGKDEDEPEYSTTSWFAMLFSAGMGIGLVFWGVAEPVSHYIDPPEELEGGTALAARISMRYSFFHWGLHPWAIYSVIALSLAYFQFRKGYKGLISSTFVPLLGERVNGPIGKTIDVLAIIATTFGVATSLGLGTLQIAGGIEQIFGYQSSTFMMVIIIVIVTVLYLGSSTTGLDRGIRILSNANLVIAVLLLLFVLFVGPTSFIFDTFTVTLGGYMQNLVQMSLRMTPFSDSTWVAAWTLFYWAWWISWAPFVGTFIARVSKGRTIREFVLGVLLVPSLFGCLWFAVFGGAGIYSERYQNSGLADAVQNDVTSALFLMLQNLPMGIIVSFLALMLIAMFFITSADSATFVLGMLSSNGDLHPSGKIKVTWGIVQSSIAIVLLVSGGLSALQTASIVVALPFAIIMIGMCVSLHKALSEEHRESRKRDKRMLAEYKSIFDAAKEQQLKENGTLKAPKAPKLPKASKNTQKPD